MATAELAAVLPVLVLLLAFGLWLVAVCSAQVRAGDAAHELARAAARNDEATGRQLAADQAPGGRFSVSRQGGTVVATVRVEVRPLSGLVPGVAVTGRAEAAVEPVLAGTVP